MQGRDGDRNRRSLYLPPGHCLNETTERGFVVLRRGHESEVGALQCDEGRIVRRWRGELGRTAGGGSERLVGRLDRTDA